MEMPRPGVRLDRLVDALEVVKGLLGGGPFTYDGEYHRARRRDEPSAPRCSSRGRACSSAARATGCCGSRREHADGWNTCWVWTPDAYAERLRRARRRVHARRPRSGDDVAHARALRAVRRGRARSRAPLRAVARAVAAGRARRRRPRDVPRPAASSAPSTRCARRSASGRRSASTRWCSAWARCRSRCRRPTTSSCCSTRAPAAERGPIRTVRSGRRRGDQLAAAAQDAAAFALGGAAPHAVLDAVERARTRGTRPAPGSSTQMCWADSTPRPSDGKNSVGLAPRQRACSIHAYSSGVSSTITSPFDGALRLALVGSTIGATSLVSSRAPALIQPLTNTQTFGTARAPDFVFACS